MRCLYEVLDLDHDADDDAIKRAYRLQALKWHPDKNTSLEAEERFKEICNAFEVLSDVHERAWYDSHRDSILNSDTLHQAGGTTSEPGSGDLPDLYPYFTSSCFNGHHSGPKGFYSVFGEVFDKIGHREVEAGGSPGVEFGNEESHRSEVLKFYNYWSSFVTSIDFAFVDEFNLASAPNRRVRRAMEDQNSKKRKLAKREYIDTVRQLASFVKKRDLRVLRIQKEKADRKMELKAQEEVRRKEAVEQKRRKAAQYQDADWIAQSELLDVGSEESEDDVRNELWCVICDKVFKSERALENHEKSKKHREKVAMLEKEIEAENESTPLETHLDSESIVEDHIKDEKIESGLDANDDDFIVRFSGLSHELNTNQTMDCVNDDEESEPLECSKVVEEDVLSSKPKKKKSRRAKKGKKVEDGIREELSQETSSSFNCVTCNAQFSSRNQLFKHIRQTKHARTKL